MGDLARQVRQAFYGEEVQRIQRGRDEVKIMVRYPRSERSSLDQLDQLRIRTADGAEVPFWSVASATIGRGYSDIHRTDRQRVVNVTADIDRSVITSNEVLQEFREKHLPEIVAAHPGLTLNLEGEQEDQRKAFSGLGRSFPMALLGIFALLAIPLRSYVQPLIIMSVIPFGIVGAVIGHVVMFEKISFPSVMGIVALSGVVVNASLVLVDTVNRLRESGRSLRDAVELAAASRFRPIILTAITTFAGLSPLLFGRSLQAKILLPMATSMAFGVIFATAITLVLVPCSYIIIEDAVRYWSRPRPAGPRAVKSSTGSDEEAA
jgi:multidrug efflux pump subunit AcrB